MHARLETFGWGPQGNKPPKAKARRPSARSKKAGTTTEVISWPLQSPAPYDLAYAGFIFKPTSASPDNVQCFNCGCQLDGWEPADTPAYEHLTHSPTCAFAINICIRYRQGDPDRVEEDPLSEHMMAARRSTFGDYWDLDTSAGFPSVEQMVEAGWYYDPSEENPDGVTCPYCSLSLDAWTPTDDPLEEHRRREPTCLFFTLKELYHPLELPQSKKGKRTSSRTSSASTKSITKKSSTAKSKATKGKGKVAKRQSEQTNASVDISELPVEVPVSKPTRGRKRESQLTESSIDFSEPPRPVRRTKRASQQTDNGLDSSTLVKPVRKTKRQSQQTDTGLDSSIIVKPGRKTKQQREQTDTALDVPESPKPGRRTKQLSQQTDNGNLFSDPSKPIESPKPGQKTKRQSQQTDNENLFSDPPKPAPAKPARKAKRQSEQTDMSIDPPAPPPAKASRSKATKRKSDQMESDPPEGEFRRSKRTRTSDGNPQLEWPTFSPPESMIACTPPAVFRPETPQAVTPPTPVPKWNPVDLEIFFDRENLPAITKLTSPEKRMTIEEFLMHEAKRQEENLRVQMMQQVAKLDVEYARALAAVDEL
ncbi:uncharacterized protein EI97DRAFT_450033 [Westerdykella ornata]|uniref:BIR-domain-containing protein n=1 Tax=Westerdykella ornata TaxID=318751 RepID=A0A6A6JKS1_WESOR|nr:uncharacterized protein EI97DRAFT_450033 [Westerdykella ornata]KAF2276713.1 hypothetical protein EI97DRAFT_450033 [Westerdykella ornata]